MSTLTLELNISKKEFIEKLQSLTIPISVEKINQINQGDLGTWFKSALKQDYNTINKQFTLEHNVFAETQIPENYLFAGEVNDNVIKIFIADPVKDEQIKTDYLEKIADEKLKTLLQQQKETKHNNYNIKRLMA